MHDTANSSALSYMNEPAFRRMTMDYSVTYELVYYSYMTWHMNNRVCVGVCLCLCMNNLQSPPKESRVFERQLISWYIREGELLLYREGELLLYREGELLLLTHRELLLSCAVTTVLISGCAKKSRHTSMSHAPCQSVMSHAAMRSVTNMNESYHTSE